MYILQLNAHIAIGAMYDRCRNAGKNSRVLRDIRPVGSGSQILYGFQFRAAAEAIVVYDSRAGRKDNGVQ